MIGIHVGGAFGAAASRARLSALLFRRDTAPLDTVWPEGPSGLIHRVDCRGFPDAWDLSVRITPPDTVPPVFTR